MKRPRMLSAPFVKNVSEPGRYGDGYGSRGLSLLVTRYSNGRVGKRWQQRTRINGRYTTLPLGHYPEVKLSEARQMALANSRKIAQGVDPRLPGVLTFQEAAEQYIERMSASWAPGTIRQWRESLRNHAYPVIGTERMDRILRADVLRVLEPVWLTQPVLGKRLRRQISAIMQDAVVRDWRADDPAAPAIVKALPAQNHRTEHREAVAVDDAPRAYGALADAERTLLATRLAARWLAVTAARSGEVLAARWSEIDLEGNGGAIPTWTIPADRTKTKTERRVPLSREALVILDEAKGVLVKKGGSRQLLFPNRGGRAMKTEALRRVNRKVVGATAHGWRSTFRSWAAEAGKDRTLAEMSLGHTVGSKVEQAYQRSDLLDLRAPLMKAWAEYLTSTKGQPT